MPSPGILSLSMTLCVTDHPLSSVGPLPLPFSHRGALSCLTCTAYLNNRTIETLQVNLIRKKNVGKLHNVYV